MPLHLVKLCVGADAIEDLERWRDTSAPGGQLMCHTTRMTPKRGKEILDGGSLYWVIKRVIQARQRIVELEDFVDSDGIKRCNIWLDPEIVPTAPSPKRPFQGHQELILEGNWQAARSFTLPVGTLVVTARQPLGVLAAQLLEPTSDDGLSNWNFFEAQTDEHYPVLRMF